MENKAFVIDLQDLTKEYGLKIDQGTNIFAVYFDDDKLFLIQGNLGLH